MAITHASEYSGTDPRIIKHREIAYELQKNGAIEGALKGSLVGGVIVWGLHLTFPLVRRQTLAGKTFLASWFTIFGMVTTAEKYLQSFEKQTRVHDNSIRTLAMQELGSTGVVPTEQAIREWRDRYDEAQARQK